jgi:hypothetical protein
MIVSRLVASSLGSSSRSAWFLLFFGIASSCGTRLQAGAAAG